MPGKIRSKAEQAFTQVRLSSELFRKSKILAAVYDISFNQLVINALQNEIKKYEATHDPLPEFSELEN